MAFYFHTVLIGEVQISVSLDAQPIAPAVLPIRTATADPYSSIFVSYSHQDALVVDRLAQAYKVLGMTFLRDVETLRSGQEWSGELLRMIHAADIFQLYWSRAARESKFVEQEWREALQCQRPGFIRPV